jgi:PAP2 superfamily protein
MVVTLARAVADAFEYTGGRGGLMSANRNRKLIVQTLAVLSLGLAALARADGFPGGLQAVWGARYTYGGTPASELLSGPRSSRVGDAGSVLYWNEVAMDANAIDHTPPAAGESRIFGEQLGPARTSLAFAIVHIAVFDAVNAIVGGYQSFTGLDPAPYGTSVKAAVARAAHDTLIALFPSQRTRFAALLADDLSGIPAGLAKENGIELGRRAAEAILALRANDGSDHPEPRVELDFFPSNRPGKWRPDPVSQSPLALGAQWRMVKPLIIASASQFRSPPPPAMGSLAYSLAFDEVKAFGGDGVNTLAARNPDQAMAAIYWAYDGTPGLGTPPRLYNQIAAQIAQQRGASVIELARLFALINVAMADAALACWESKYYYQFWRPVAGIRESDLGTGPTRAGDGNVLTLGDISFTPLGAPASNLQGPNFTPPFPAYPSGHATFGSALFQILRHAFGTDDIAFTFVSDEFNGKTRDNEGRVRPRMPRTFASLSDAEEENGQSRIYLGIHWAFDKTEGARQGRMVADYVFGNAFVPSSH